MSNMSRLKSNIKLESLVLIIIIIMMTSLNLCLGESSEKIDEQVHERLENGERPSIIVEFHRPDPYSKAALEIQNLMNEISIVSKKPSSSSSLSLTKLVHRLQTDITKRMSSVITAVEGMGKKLNILWASHEIHVPMASAELINRLAEMINVKVIRLEGIFIPRVPPQEPGSRPPIEGNSTWNLGLTDARCKNITCLGKGVVVGFIDSGALVTHEEIKGNWIGAPYGFYDGTADSPNCTARDEDGWGTLAVGVACGKNVGVAPDAKWMMCMGCTSTNCSEAAVKMCGQYLACPWQCRDTTQNKLTKNCAKRPHVINNSWSMDSYHQLLFPFYFFYETLQLWNSLGIISAFDIGLYGPVCTSTAPPGAYDIAIGVGTVDSDAVLAWYSSVGPQLSMKPISENSTASGTCFTPLCPKTQHSCKLIKPDIVAPGEAINTSFIGSNTDYVLTSAMATPHVSGVIALMLCANNKVHWDYKEAYKILTETADTSMIDLLGERQAKGSWFAEDSNLMCNVISDNICNTYPNNLYGWGLTYACKAVTAAKARK